MFAVTSSQVLGWTNVRCCAFAWDGCGDDTVAGHWSSRKSYSSRWNGLVVIDCADAGSLSVITQVNW